MESSARLFIERPLSEEALLAVSNEADRCLVADFASVRRRCETLMWRYIVRRELGSDTEISYDRNGAPQLDNREECIGVSHSDDFVAVIISRERCAIDIERLDRNFGHVAARYISTEERMLSSDPRTAAVIWCAKETLYKYSGERELDLLRDLKVASIDFEHGYVVGQIRDNTPVQMHLEFHSGNAVVYIA